MQRKISCTRARNLPAKDTEPPSQKMYKTRVKRWGLAKNLMPWDASQVQHDYKNQIAADNEVSTVVIRGRAVSRRKVERFLKRAAKDPSTQPAAALKRGGIRLSQPLTAASSLDLTHATISSAPGRLRSPDTFRIPEEIILLTRQLSAGSRESGFVSVSLSHGLPGSQKHLLNEHVS
jgi:hypothetical protein